MTRHRHFDGGEQSDVLTRLRVRSGRTRTQIAADLGMEADTYRRYENGQTELRVSQLPAFARAYGVSTAALARELGLADEVDVRGESWDFKAELHRARPDDPAFAERIYREAIGWPIDVQQTMVDAIRRLTEHEREAENPHNERPNMRQRAQFGARKTGT